MPWRMENLIAHESPRKNGENQAQVKNTDVAGAGVLPVGHQRDRVLGALRALELVAVRHPGRARGGQALGGGLALHRPGVQVDVMRVEVVRDVRALA